VGGPHLRDGVGARHLHGVGVAPGVEQALALVPADPDLLGEVVLGVDGHGELVSHARKVIGAPQRPSQG